MSKGLEALREIDKDTPFSQAFNPKFKERMAIIEKELKEKDYLDSFLDGIFNTFELSVSGDKFEDGGYSVKFDFGDGHSMTIYCKTKEEFNYWKGMFSE